MNGHRSRLPVDPLQLMQCRQVTPHIGQTTAQFVDIPFGRTVLKCVLDGLAVHLARRIAPAWWERAVFFVRPAQVVLAGGVAQARLGFHPPLAQSGPSDQSVGLVVEEAGEIVRWCAVVPRLSADGFDEAVLQPVPVLADGGDLNKCERISLLYRERRREPQCSLVSGEIVENGSRRGTDADLGWSRRRR